MIKAGFRDGTWAIVAQGLSSVSNFGLLLVVAHSTSPAEFGAVAVAAAVAVFLVNVCRAVCGDAFVLKAAALDAPERHLAVSSSAIAAFLTGLLMSTAAVGIWIGVVGGRIAAAIVLASLPLICLEDHLRVVGVSSERSRAAASGEMLWILVQTVGTLTFSNLNRLSPTNAVLTWIAGASMASVWHVTQLPLPIRLQLRQAGIWIKTHRNVAVPHAIEYVVVAGLAQAAMIGVVGILGFEAGGALRGALLMLAPPTIVLAGFIPFGTARVVNLLRADCGRAIRLLHRLPVPLAAMCVAWAAVVLLLPNSAGELILGRQWIGARKVMIFGAISIVAIAVSVPAVIGLRAHDAVRTALGRRVFVALMFPLAGMIGARAGGIRGAAAALASVQCLDTFVLWSVLVPALRQVDCLRGAPVERRAPDEYV